MRYASQYEPFNSIYSMMSINNIPETRGRPNKYDFDGIEVGQVRIFKGARRENIRECCKSYCIKRGMKPWKIIIRTLNGDIHLLRLE